MTDAQLAELSRTLYSPWTLVVLTIAMLAYLYAMAFGAVGREIAGSAEAADRTRKGRRAEIVGTSLTIAGILMLITHMVTRSLASGRPPLGNMFEFSTVMALTVLLAGVVVVQFKMKRPELMGFVVLGAVLTMGLALLVYAEPGPLMPILDSWWRGIHVSAIVFAAGIFTVGFVFMALYLLRDTAERYVASLRTSEGSTVGAAHMGDVAVMDDDEYVVEGRLMPDADGGVEGTPEELAEYRSRMREAINPWKLFGGTFLAVASLSWVFAEPVTASAPLSSRALSINLTMALAALIAWWAIPYLPDAATLDMLSYRTIAFGFPIWTFAVITGAIWAEQSWGRFWGWDPKETSAFLTWVAYAGYLHARATRGVKGRTAAWIGMASYGILMFTYYVVNLVVVGLHSYA